MVQHKITHNFTYQNHYNLTRLYTVHLITLAHFTSTHIK